MALVLNAAQLPDLYYQAQAYAQHPPAGHQPLQDLTDQLQTAIELFPEQIVAIQQALENVGRAYAMILAAEHPHGQAAAPPADEEFLQPQYEEQLLPPEPILLGGFNEADLDPAAQAVILAQFQQPAERRREPQAQAIESAQGTCRTEPIAEQRALNVSTSPVAQPAALESSLLNRILHVLRSFIETMCSWFNSFISYCSQTRQPAPVVISPQPAQASVIEQQQQPLQPTPAPLLQQNAQPVEEVVVASAPDVPDFFQGVGHIEPGENRGIQCAKAMAHRLGLHLSQNGQENEIPDLVSAAVLDQDQNLAIETYEIPRWGIEVTQDYANEMRFLSTRARMVRDHLIRAMIMKGDEVHCLMIDARVPAAIQFYYFNPYAPNAYVQRFARGDELVAHLGQTLPVNADIPFRIRGLLPNPNLQN